MIWVTKKVAIGLHGKLILGFGGAHGNVRDEGLLDSALARAQNIAAYEGEDDLFRLAAAYGYGIVRNHPFLDGNKRTAFVVMDVFLKSNGYRLRASEPDVVVTMTQFAANIMSEADMAEWLRRNSVPLA